MVFAVPRTRAALGAPRQWSVRPNTARVLKWLRPHLALHFAVFSFRSKKGEVHAPKM